MTTPMVLLGLALLAGAIVWLLSVRQPGSQLRPSGSDSDSDSGSDAGFGPGSAPSSAVQEPDPEPIGVMELGAPDPAPAAEATAAPTVVGQGLDSFAFGPVAASDDLDLKTRLLGLLGLISLILLTSAVVAVGLWMLGRGIRLEFAHLAGH
jgi:hypothetical protein